MNKSFFRDAFGWGFILWLIGYILGIALFMVVPPSQIGWVIMPVGVVITAYVAMKKVKGDSLGFYIILAVVWTLLAIVLDYFLLVRLFKPADGYYKLDVYIYYGLTFLIPLGVGLLRRNDTVQAN
jgi:hypothetical protein